MVGVFMVAVLRSLGLRGKGETIAAWLGVGRQVDVIERQTIPYLRWLNQRTAGSAGLNLRYSLRHRHVALEQVARTGVDGGVIERHDDLGQDLLG